MYECPKPTIVRIQGDVYAGRHGLVSSRHGGGQRRYGNFA
jgi:hypothetical protein